MGWMAWSVKNGSIFGPLTTGETADDYTITREKFLCIKRGVRFWSGDMLEFLKFLKQRGFDSAGTNDLEQKRQK